MKVGTKCRVIKHILVIIAIYNLDTEQNIESMHQHFKFDIQPFSRIGTNKKIRYNYEIRNKTTRVIV